MNNLYVLQYDGDGYCSPFSGEIFTSKDMALECIKNDDTEGFRYVSVYEYDSAMERYKESNRLYYMGKIKGENND